MNSTNVIKRLYKKCIQILGIYNANTDILKQCYSDFYNYHRNGGNITCFLVPLGMLYSRNRKY